MTNVGTIILLLVCVGMGYVIEPLLFSLREQRKPETSEADKQPEPEKKPEPPMLAPAPAPSIQVDLSLVKPEDFPAEVELRETIHITEAKSGMTMELKSGTKVKPLRLEGNDLVYETVGIPLESRINVDSTNFKELVIPAIMKRLSKGGGVKEPEPEPEPVFLDKTAIVALIKTHVGAGEISEFKPEQVTSWEAGEDMEYDGASYQTGRVTFEAETILGKQQYQAIALIKNGEVAKWIWAKTLLEMR